MSITGVPDYDGLVQDYTIEPAGNDGSGVPTSRVINATPPITIDGTTSADLDNDVTLALTTSPTGQTPVGVTRTLTGTTPIRIDGGNSADLSADRTISVIPFTGAADGIVTHNPSGVQGKFLKDDNSWGVSATAGVSDITATPGLTASASTGSVTLDQNLANITTKGGVPATGGADATKFLCATNPITWAVPGTGSFIRLQSNYSGSTPDTGTGRVSGNLAADTRLLAGTITGANIPTGARFISTGDATGADHYFSCHSADSTPPSIIFTKTRGTEASPSVASDADGLFSIWAKRRNSGGSYTSNEFVRAKFDGSATASDHALWIEYMAGSTTSFSNFRQSSAGHRFISAQSSLPGNSVRALHTVDVQGSFGILPTIVTSGGGGPTYSRTLTDADSSLVFADATTYTTTITLPAASGRAGRVYKIVKVDTTSFRTVTVIPPSGTINGVAGWTLGKLGEYIEVTSDGTSWWITGSRLLTDQSNVISGTTVANTASETTMMTTGLTTSWNATAVATSSGQIFRIRAAGKLSTTGTPTLRVKIKGGAATILADTTAITMPSGASNIPWQIDYEQIMRSSLVSRVSKAVFMLGATTQTVYTMLSNTGSISENNPETITVQWGSADPANTITPTAGTYSIGYDVFNF